MYAVGHPVVTQLGRWMAAVLAADPEAALSHRSAAELWGLLQRSGRVADARHGLPAPRFNPDVKIAGRFLRPDCAWPDRRLAVELDGRA